jgi:hypothetical protein
MQMRDASIDFVDVHLVGGPEDGRKIKTGAVNVRTLSLVDGRSESHNYVQLPGTRVYAWTGRVVDDGTPED